MTTCGGFSLQEENPVFQGNPLINYFMVTLREPEGMESMCLSLFVLVSQNSRLKKGQEESLQVNPIQTNASSAADPRPFLANPHLAFAAFL